MTAPPIAKRKTCPEIVLSLSGPGLKRTLTFNAEPGRSRQPLEGMKLAKSAGDPKAAELVACEAVVLAEVKDHLDWDSSRVPRRRGSGGPPPTRSASDVNHQAEQGEDDQNVNRG
ncbi:MAG TPA: hypothetical protein VH853_13600 [Polyangia bacterium]|nr:hypothetical protein [Polyangia bacterium]